MQEPIKDAPPTTPRHGTPLFLFVCKDGLDGATHRVAQLAGHLAHVETHWRSYVVAGPMRQPDEKVLSGSFFLVLAPTLDQAWDLMRGDPYFTCGLYANIEVTEVTPSIGLWVGGKIWADAASLVSRATGG